jgi:hypothetical protein
MFLYNHVQHPISRQARSYQKNVQQSRLTAWQNRTPKSTTGTTCVESIGGKWSQLDVITQRAKVTYSIKRSDNDIVSITNSLSLKI